MLTYSDAVCASSEAETLSFGNVLSLVSRGTTSIPPGACDRVVIVSKDVNVK
jgi:hypothetical protein